MFAYNPTVNDMSGQIYAQGMNNAAEMQMQMMGQMGNDIGGAIASIAGQYQERETQKAKGRATKKLLEVVGPSIGMTTDKLKEVFGELKSDADWAQAGDMIGPVLPSLINQQLNQSRMGMQQNQQALTAAMPKVRNIADAQAQVAAGQGTMPAPSGINFDYVR